MRQDYYFLPQDPTAVELRAFTHGLMPRSVPAMMQHFLDDWRLLGVEAWNEVPNHWRPGSSERVGWWSLPEYLGDEFLAPLLGAPPGTCIMQPNVHWTMQCLLSADEPFEEKREVVATTAEFPSVLHSIHQWAPLRKLRPHVLGLNTEGSVDRDAVLGAIGEETALVVLSHVGFTTGEKLTDVFLRAVAERVHHYDGLLAIDGYHASGSVPVDVQDLGVDVYFGGLLKEGSGSSGSGYVYLRPGLELTPRLTGWFGDGDPFAFNPFPVRSPGVRRRFLGGTTAIAPLYHAAEGIRLLLDAGLEAVRELSLGMTARSIERAEAAGLRVRSPRDPARRGAMVILEVEEAGRLCAFLKSRGVYTDSRQGRYLRMVPFMWNTLDEVDRAFHEIAAATASRAYMQMSPETDRSGPVT